MFFGQEYFCRHPFALCLLCRLIVTASQSSLIVALSLSTVFSLLSWLISEQVCPTAWICRVGWLLNQDTVSLKNRFTNISRPSICSYDVTQCNLCVCTSRLIVEFINNDNHPADRWLFYLFISMMRWHRINFNRCFCNDNTMAIVNAAVGISLSQLIVAYSLVNYCCRDSWR